MDAEELRALIRDIIPWMDASIYARLVNVLVDRAARNPSGWVPTGPTEAIVANIVGFAKAAKRVGYADPSDVDEYLRRGSHAFLGKRYGAAYQIFRALLIPIGDVDIDLGQHEMLDEVLGVDVAACAAQYVLCRYMTAATPKKRGRAVLAAIDEMRGIGHFRQPLRELERVAVEPLPQFEAFLVQWRALVEERTRTRQANDWDSDEDDWLREAVEQSEGPDGLATLARASKRAADLDAWCRALVAARDWSSALIAYDEAAKLVTDAAYTRGGFLDGAALAARELGRKDLPQRLEHAWRKAPSMIRLRRWLGSSKTRKVFGKRVGEALSVCPTQARRQQALLHVLGADFSAAAQLLAAAPGLGWSDEAHPGHLLFPLFASLLGDVEMPKETERDFNDLSLLANQDEPRLQTPDTAALLDLATVEPPSDADTCAAVLEAMRTAAEKRIAGVTEHKRRRRYEHVASLALVCVQVDGSSETTAWLAAIVDKYRRFPALQRALGQRGRRR